MKAGPARILADGIIAGGIGHIVIALTLITADLWAGRWMLHTPALLGSALFGEVGVACQVPHRAEPVLAYTSLHLLVIITLGLVASLLVQASERRPILWAGALFCFIVVVWHLTGAVLVILGPVQNCLSLWWVIAASIAGASSMAVYLWRARPALSSQLRGDRFA